MSLLLLFGKGPSGPAAPPSPTVKQAVYGRALNLYSASRRRPLFATHPIIGYIDVPAGGQTFTQNLSDSQLASDLFSKNLTKVQLEAAVLAAVLARILKKFFPTDAQTQSDSSSGLLAKSLGDTQAPSDNFNKILSKRPLDNQAVVDALAKTLQKYIIGDTETTVDAFSATVLKSVGLTDTQSPSDAFNKVLSMHPFDNQITIDALARTLAKFIVGDTETMTDSFSATVLKSLGLNDTQSPSDAFSKIFSMRPAENQVVADALAKTLFKFLVGDGERVADSFVTTVLKSVGLIDTQSPSDELSKILSSHPAEGLVNADALSKTQSKYVTGDAETQTDSALLVRFLFLAMADSLTTQDSIARIISKGLSDNAAIADAFSKILRAVILDSGGVWGDAATATRIAPSVPAVLAVYIESILTEIKDATFHAAGIADPEHRIIETTDPTARKTGSRDAQKRISEILDAIRHKAGTKGFKR